MRALILVLALLSPAAQARAPDIDAIVTDHILPGYQALEARAKVLSEVASEDCSPTNPALQAAYHDAFDAWIRVSHLRFGPSETEERAFALAFWPDPRGSTPKALASILRDEDPVVYDQDAFTTVSVAARGFYALEFLLFDPQFAAEPSAFSCALIQAVAGDMALVSAAIHEDWETGYADLMLSPGNDVYRTDAEAARQLFTALTTGLEFTETQRLGRPLGTFDRPRPNRAEARRSGRSLRHVVLSLEATRDLALLMAGDDPELIAKFSAVIEKAKALDDPVLAGVANPGQRFRIEVIQQDVTTLRRYLLEKIGPQFGITAGFNSLDGD